MRSAFYNLLFMSFAAWAVAGCVGESASPAGLRAAEQALQKQGVYYLEATGTAESPVFTFYDRNKAVIGDGQSSQNPQQTEIQWRGRQWDSVGGAFGETGAAIGSDGADAAELDTALTVFELSLDQAFPSSASGLNTQVHANSCVNVHCSRPSHRCMGGCTGYVCSNPSGGTCQLPGGGDPQPRPRPTPNSQPQD